METLESLAKFTEKYPQKIGDRFQYAFLGGTAIRLHQQQAGVSEYRPISDFDLLVFGEQKYPVHSFTPSSFFDGSPMKRRELFPHISKVFIRDKNYYAMNGAFLSLTKTCAIDTPREKDYVDLTSIHSIGLIDDEKLASLFLKSSRITKNTPLVSDTFKWFFEGEQNSGKIKLFQAFPRLVNLLDEFSDSEHPFYLDCVHKARSLLLGVAEKSRHSGYEFASIVYDIDTILRELPIVDRKKTLRDALSFAERQDYRDFSELVHNQIAPALRFATSDDVKRSHLRSVFSA